MKRRNIKKVIKEKIENYLESVEDKDLVKQMKKDILVTGGSIASMFLDEQINDFDIYFKTRETTLLVKLQRT